MGIWLCPLMWEPGFPYTEKLPTILQGYHRAFCVYSHHYRGTTELPGLVLGASTLEASVEVLPSASQLRPDMRLSPNLDERELIGYAYKPKRLPISFNDGTNVLAHTYIAD